VTTSVYDAAAVRRALLDWYAREQRDLPWRRTTDPWAIWVSEAMLQQTRVEVVRERWSAFLERFPEPAALAEASDEALLAAWSGLGYYRRARSLRDAARAVVERHEGAFPRTREEALALPGVGPYTAGAVLSIAYDLPEPLVDGNVARVLARLDELEAPLGSRELEAALWERAAGLVPRRARSRARGPGALNQALMELGALVCVPRTPRCDACPLASGCLARASGRAAGLPRPAPRRARVDVDLDVLLVERRGRVLLARRPSDGRMAGMLELPTRERTDAADRPARLWPEGWPGPGLEAGKELAVLSHGITHHRIRARLLAGRLAAGSRVAAPLLWARAPELDGLELTGLARKALKARHPG
jgi:A/G-specific adenine glycosylase